MRCLRSKQLCCAVASRNNSGCWARSSMESAPCRSTSICYSRCSCHQTSTSSVSVQVLGEGCIHIQHVRVPRGVDAQLLYLYRRHTTCGPHRMLNDSFIHSFREQHRRQLRTAAWTKWFESPWRIVLRELLLVAELLPPSKGLWYDDRSSNGKVHSTLHARRWRGDHRRR
jgi:hypothetical protein